MLLKDTLNHFFYTMSVNELQLMNEKFKNLNITYNSLLYLESYCPDTKMYDHTTCTNTSYFQVCRYLKSE